MPVRANAVAGSLTEPMGPTSTSMVSDGLLDLPTISGDFARVTVYRRNPAGRVTAREIVHVTAHESGEMTATVQRAREGTTAGDWVAGDRWDHATTAADLNGMQPLDSDLTAIAALATTEFGRSLLTHANAEAVRTAIDVLSASATGDAIEVARAALDAAKVDHEEHGTALGRASLDGGLGMDVETARWGLRDDGTTYYDDDGPDPGDEAILTTDGDTLAWTRVADVGQGSSIRRFLPADLLLPDGWLLAYDASAQRMVARAPTPPVGSDGSVIAVSTQGNDGNDGLSWAAAKATITAAVAALPDDGGTVLVGGGVFEGRSAIDRDNARVVGVGLGTTLRLADGVNGDAQVLTNTGDGVTVEHLTIDGNEGGQTQPGGDLRRYNDGLASYGSNFTARSVVVRNCQGGGIATYAEATHPAANASRAAGVRRTIRYLDCVVENVGIDSRARAAFYVGGAASASAYTTDVNIAGCVSLGGRNTQAVSVHNARNSNVHDCIFIHTRDLGRLVAVWGAQHTEVHHNAFVSRVPDEGYPQIGVTIRGGGDISRHTEVTDNWFYADEGAASFVAAVRFDEREERGSAHSRVARNRFIATDAAARLVEFNLGEHDDIEVDDNTMHGTGGGDQSIAYVRTSTVTLSRVSVDRSNRLVDVPALLRVFSAATDDGVTITGIAPQPDLSRLDLAVSDPPTQAEVQAVADRLDAILDLLLDSGLTN